MPYGEILKTAFSIARRNRYLWFFGLFAGGGASLNVPTNFDFGGAGGGRRGDEDPVAEAIASIDPGVIVGLVALAVVLALVALLIYLVAQGALTESVAAIDRGGERRFGTAWKAGTRRFWRVLGWAALVFVIGVAILIVVGGPLAGLVIGVFSATEATGARVAVVIVVALIAIAAFVLLLIPLQIVAELSVRELVLREERPVAALRSGYRMFRANLGPSALVWLIQFGIGIGVVVVLAIALAIIGILLFLPTIGLVIADVVAGAIVAGVIAGLILLALFVVAFGAFGTFAHAVWTLAYLRLKRPEPQPSTQ